MYTGTIVVRQLSYKKNPYKRGICNLLINRRTLIEKQNLYTTSQLYLKRLCEDIPERSVGSTGNREATQFFREEISSCGWKTETVAFDALDWKDGGATLTSGTAGFKVYVSPYSPACKVTSELVKASTIDELEQVDARDKIILLYGEIAKEQLMPKNFVFYNPEEHQKIISLLENSGTRAIICATGRNPSLAGGVYPFPLIEDGDFTIPSVYMTEEEGRKLIAHCFHTQTGLSKGKEVFLESISELIPGKGYNVIAVKGPEDSVRIVITAHIDAKKGTPGAIDNATGVVVLLLLARLLSDYKGKKLIEIAAFNGEDYYSVPGQMAYIRANRDKFNTILLNINIDGAGYIKGRSAFSFFNVPEDIRKKVDVIVKKYSGITEGIQWPQGDHSIFIQNGRPAIAISSEWFINNSSTQAINHTPKDNPDIVDCHKLVEIAEALKNVIINLD